MRLICRRQTTTREALPAMEATAMMGMAALGPKARLSTGSRIMDDPVPTTPLIAPAAMPHRAMSAYIMALPHCSQICVYRGVI